MGKSVIINWRETNHEGPSSGQTVYFAPGADIEADSNEYPIPFPSAGTIRNFRLVVSANGITGPGDSTVSVKVGGAARLSVSYASGETGQKTDASEYVVSAGDLFSIEAVGGGTGGTNLSVAGFLLEYEPTDGSTYTLFCANRQSSINFSGNITRYLAPFGDRASSTAIGEVQYVSPIAGEIQYLSIATGTVQSGCGTNTVSVNINGSIPTSPPQVVGGEGDGQTILTDDVNVAAVEVDDLVTIQWTTTGNTGGNFNYEKLFWWLKSDNNEFVLADADFINGQRMSPNGTYYFPVGGSILEDEGAAQTAVEIDLPFGFTAKLLHVWSDSEAGTTPTHTVHLLDDAGAETDLTLSYDDAEVGWKRDEVNEYEVPAETALSYKITMPAGGINRDWNVLGIVAAVAAFVPATSAGPYSRRQRLNLR